MGKDITAKFKCHLQTCNKEQGHQILRPIQRSSHHLKCAIRIYKEIKSLGSFLQVLEEEEKTRVRPTSSHSRAKLNVQVIQKLNSISDEISQAKKDLFAADLESEHSRIHKEEIFGYLQRKLHRFSNAFDEIQTANAKRLDLLEEFSTPKNVLPKITSNELGLLPLEMEISESERATFIQEQAEIEQELESSTHQTQQVERQLRELAQLHEVMSHKIVEQAEEIELIHKSTVNSRLAVVQGNENLAEVSEEPLSQRMLLSHLVMGLSLFLFLFNYIAK